MCAGFKPRNGHREPGQATQGWERKVSEVSMLAAYTFLMVLSLEEEFPKMEESTTGSCASFLYVLYM